MKRASIVDHFRRNRVLAARTLPDIERRKWLSPLLYGNYTSVLAAIREHATGATIDLGCGDQVFAEAIRRQATTYESLDIEARVNDLTYIDDIQRMSKVAADRYDTAVCVEVLEHVPHPWQALSQIHRILKSGGVLVLSVPHLSRLHEEPNDFFRYTRYGVQSLLEDQGFTVISIRPYAGLFSFLGHQWSMAIVISLWHLPVIRQVIFHINRWTCVALCRGLDHLIDRRRVFAAGYVAVARKGDARV